MGERNNIYWEQSIVHPYRCITEHSDFLLHVRLTTEISSSPKD